MECSHEECPQASSLPLSTQIAELQAMIELERTTRETTLRRVENQVALAIRGMARLSADVASAADAGHASHVQTAPAALDPAGEARLTSSIRSALTLEFAELQLAISDARAAVKEEAEQRAAGDRATAESTRQVRRAVLLCVAAFEDVARARPVQEGLRGRDEIESAAFQDSLDEKRRVALERIQAELACEQEDLLTSTACTSSELEGRCTVEEIQSCQNIGAREQDSALDQDGMIPKQVVHKQIQANFTEKSPDMEYCNDDVIRMIMEHKAFVEGRLCDVQNNAAHQNDVHEDRYSELQSAIIALTSCVSQIQDATGQMAAFTAHAAAAGQFCMVPGGVAGHRQEAPSSPGTSMMAPVAGAAAERAESIAAAVASEGGITWSRVEPQASSLSVPSASRRASSAESPVRAKASPSCEPLTPVSETLPSRPATRCVSRGRSPLEREAGMDKDVSDNAGINGAPPPRHVSQIQATATPRGLVRHVPASPAIDSSSVPRVRQPLSGSAACPPGDSVTTVFSSAPLCSPQISSHTCSRLWPSTFRVASGSASLPLGGNSVRHTLQEDIPQGVASLPARSGHGSPTPAFAHRTTVRPRSLAPKTTLGTDRVSTGPALAVTSGSLRVGPGAHPFSNTAVRTGSPPPTIPGYMTPRPLQYR